MLEVADIRGDLVGVGDTIAYSVRDGDMAGFRVGVISEVVPAKEGMYSTKVPTKLRVVVAHSSGYGLPEKPVLINASLKRFVKVGP